MIVCFTSDSPPPFLSLSLSPVLPPPWELCHPTIFTLRPGIGSQVKLSPAEPRQPELTLQSSCEQETNVLVTCFWDLRAVWYSSHKSWPIQNVCAPREDRKSHCQINSEFLNEFQKYLLSLEIKIHVKMHNAESIVLNYLLELEKHFGNHNWVSIKLEQCGLSSRNFELLLLIYIPLPFHFSVEIMKLIKLSPLLCWKWVI